MNQLFTVRTSGPSSLLVTYLGQKINLLDISNQKLWEGVPLKCVCCQIGLFFLFYLVDKKYFTSYVFLSNDEKLGYSPKYLKNVSTLMTIGRF